MIFERAQPNVVNKGLSNTKPSLREIRLSGSLCGIFKLELHLQNLGILVSLMKRNEFQRRTKVISITLKQARLSVCSIVRTF